MEFNERLRQVRSMMNMTQVEFAELGGVKPVTQTNYERGIRFPTLEYLLNLKSAGVDIHFIIFGDLSRPENLSAMDYKVLLAYQNASLERKRAIEFVAGIHDDSQTPNQRDTSIDRSDSSNSFTKKNTTLFSKYHLSDMKRRAIILLYALPVMLLAMLSVILFSYVLTSLKFIENVYLQMLCFTSFSILVILMIIKYTDYQLTSYESNIKRLHMFHRIFS